MEQGELYRRLVAKAYLFEDPAAYAAGVADALEAVSRLEDWENTLATVPDVVADEIVTANPLEDIATV
jgi:hypothetical protein